MTDVQRMDIDAPEVDMDDSGRLYYQSQPFTGEVTEHLGESLVSLDNYVDGYKNGPSREWYEDGTLRSEGTLREGRPVGEFKEWHSNGVLAARQVFAENGMTLLADSAWDGHGRPTRAWRKGT
ncbi:hypothetical protein [Streptomyces sp. Go-475]|uniref:toxin-antitoxin system YwqK family antitoxin n=1 Tax=Streptomyces sp. Go-475 TaxID=2072505 RepID=UPI000DEF8D5E|nr:hypothetical protein [Streptomyces sp. Go-475]AXE88401.1 MORN repeat variant [Streptomyces sp. Go-475]